MIFGALPLAISIALLWFVPRPCRTSASFVDRFYLHPL